MKYVTSHLTYEEVSQYEYLFVNILPDVFECYHIKATYLCNNIILNVRNFSNPW